MAYDGVSFEALLVQIVKLSLTLIEVIKICTFNCNPSMCFIDLNLKLECKFGSYLNSEDIFDSLNYQVLSHRPELIINVCVVHFFRTPLLLQELKCLV